MSHLEARRPREAFGVNLSAEALAGWLGAAQGGDPGAAFVVGHFYRGGLAGIPRDVSLALRWFRFAAERGIVGAQIELAKMYEAGLGVSVDPAMAATWYRAAAEQGDPGAQRRVGTLYWSGRGVAQDRNEAVRWWNDAAIGGDGTARNYMSRLLWRGDFVPRDRRRAWGYMLDVAARPDIWSTIADSDEYRRGERRLRAVVLLLVVVVCALLASWISR